MNTKQGKHFLLSAKARTFSLLEIARLSDDDAWEMFKESRWSENQVVCPKCGHESHYFIKTRCQWRCKSCNHTFTETSGTIFASHKCPANNIENRVDRRLKENQDPDKRAVLVARERCESGYGASRTITGVAMSENESAILNFAKKHVEPGSMISADEHRAYNVLHGHYKTERVNHAKMYVGPMGENNNQAESFFSRFRRMQLGQTHKFGNMYLNRYANEAAYREDTRRRSNGDIFTDIMSRCAMTGVSRHFCGYWQGNKKQVETLVV